MPACLVLVHFLVVCRVGPATYWCHLGIIVKSLGEVHTQPDGGEGLVNGRVLVREVRVKKAGDKDVG
jgi:hypothetical protein